MAVSFDSRIKSDLFVQVALGVFFASGIKLSLYKTPCLSYAVRALDCAAEIMITASHNPAKYNGYKVYETAASMQDEIREIDAFSV